MGVWGLGWVAGEIKNKAISASNLKLKLKLTEAKLGNINIFIEQGVSCLTLNKK